MNVDGHKETLVAGHPGNTNAVKFGVHSPRLIGDRAREIAGGLMQSFEFTPAEKVAVTEAARWIALLEAIDNDLDERGIVDRRGKERYLLELRVRVSARLERWLDKFAGAMDRDWRNTEVPKAEREDYVRELQRIALGADPHARTQDRLTALKQLVALHQSRPNEFVKVILPGPPMEGDIVGGTADDVDGPADEDVSPEES
jgi:hypothetical protein